MSNVYTAYILIDFPDVMKGINYKSVGAKLLAQEVGLCLPFIHNGIDLGNLEIELTKVVPSSVMDALDPVSLLYRSEFVKITLDLSNEKLYELYEKDNRESPNQLVLHRMLHFMIVCNIAVPGIFDWNGGSLLLNGKTIWKIDKCYNQLDFAYERSQKLDWPQLEFLSIQLVWDWYFKHEKGLEKPSASAVERALNAFSHSFTSTADWDFGGLFWALLGLEAIYCKGNGNLQNQLVEKTELYLGERIAFKKEVGKMYDFRSRFIHGNINFPNKFSYDDISNEWDDYIKSYQDSYHLALAILVATLQKLITTNSEAINFRLILD